MDTQPDTAPVEAAAAPELSPEEQYVWLSKAMLVYLLTQ